MTAVPSAACGPEPIALGAGELLAGKYLLVQSLASGGMGQIWLARNTTTGAEVAAKVLLPSHASAEGLARFRREARATAALSHRAIVRVFDLVELDPARGSLLMIMELLRGQTLSDRLEQGGALSVDETLEIAFPLLSALSHAHAHGIVHRDLKPENILLAIDPDGKRLPKIVDFGISKLVREHPITRDGQILGTLNYMSPEQTLGEAVDARSDVFSLGVLLYECLSGRNPFARPNEQARIELDLTSVLQIEPRPLRGIPPALWDVIRRALAKGAAERFESAADFARALSEAAPAPPPREPRSSRISPSSIPPTTSAARGDDRSPHPVARRIALAATLVLLPALAFVSTAPAARSAGPEPRLVRVAASLPAKQVVHTFDWLAVSPAPAPEDGSPPRLGGPPSGASPPGARRIGRRLPGVLKDPGF